MRNTRRPVRIKANVAFSLCGEDFWYDSMLSKFHPTSEILAEVCLTESIVADVTNTMIMGTAGADAAYGLLQGEGHRRDDTKCIRPRNTPTMGRNWSLVCQHNVLNAKDPLAFVNICPPTNVYQHCP